MKSRRLKIFRDEHGGSLVEFAIIGPLLFVILFGIIEFGIVFYDQAMITNASREGARAGIVFRDPRPSEIEIKDVVKRYCEEYLISFETGSTFDDDNITVSMPNTSPGSPVKVTINYPFKFLVLSNVLALLGDSFDQGINLRAESVMRME